MNDIITPGNALTALGIIISIFMAGKVIKTKNVNKQKNKNKSDNIFKNKGNVEIKQRDTYSDNQNVNVTNKGEE